MDGSLWMQGKIQHYIQNLLEEEVSELLGREKSERRSMIDEKPGYRNGYGKPRKLTLQCGTITLRRPRVRDLEDRFESRILPLFARRSKEIGDLLPELYLHGLSEGDFDLALRGLLGDEAPLSESTIARLKVKWQANYEEWKSRSLADRESTQSWSSVLRSLKSRGLRAPRLVIGDGHLGIWGALRNVYPEADEQRCWNHRILNILDKIPRKYQAQARQIVVQIPCAPTLKEAERLKARFRYWCEEHGYEKAGLVLERDWERMTTFYRYPKEHWRHLRTTNPIESPFASVRLRTNAAQRYKKVANATAVIWKTLMIADRKFRRLNAPELLKEVYEGARYANGIRVKEEPIEADAA